MRAHSRWIAAAATVGWIAVSHAAADQPSPKNLSAKAVEALRLLETGDSYQQQVGFLRLEALREPAAVPALLPYVSSPHPELRAGGVRALAAIQGAAAVPLLLDRLKHDRHPKVRRAAILSVEPLIPTSPAALPALIAALRDRDTTVRMAAVDVVSRVNDPNARAAILKRARYERRRDVRRVLEMAMKRLGAK